MDYENSVGQILWKFDKSEEVTIATHTLMADIFLTRDVVLTFLSSFEPLHKVKSFDSIHIEAVRLAVMATQYNYLTMAC